MSKIEVECAVCQSILRVAEVHAGKQARCPNCGGLTMIPGFDATNPEGGFSQEFPHSIEPPETQYRENLSANVPDHDATWHEPVPFRSSEQPRQVHPEGYEVPWDPTELGTNAWRNDVGKTAPMHADRGRYRITEGGPVRRPTGSEGAGVFSLVLAGMGFLSIFSCSCISPVFFAVGFGMASRATLELGRVCMWVHAGLAMFWALMFVGWMFF